MMQTNEPPINEQKQAGAKPMSKPVKILLGIPALLFLLGWSALLVLAFISVLYPEAGKPPLLATAMIAVVIVIFGMGSVMLGLIVYYIIHSLNNLQLDSTGRVIWILLLLCAAIVAMPFYWYFYIWCEPTKKVESLPPLKAVIKPSCWYYGISALVAIAGFSIFLWIIIGVLFAEKHRAVIPGKTDITLVKPGPYNIYHEYKSVVGDKIYSTSDNISGLQCIIISKETGNKIELTPSKLNSTYTTGGNEGVLKWNFHIDQPGIYELSGQYYGGKERPETVLCVEQGAGAIIYMFMATMVMAGSTILAIIIFVFVLIKRITYKNRMMAHPTGGNA